MIWLCTTNPGNPPSAGMREKRGGGTVNRRGDAGTRGRGEWNSTQNFVHLSEKTTAILELLHKSRKGVALAEKNFDFVGNLLAPMLRPYKQLSTFVRGLLTAILTTSSILKASATTTATVATVSLWQLGWFFLKVGSVLFGSGYVLVAFLEGGLVQEHGWLTQQQLLDAIAIGQFTPGPVLSTSTFIGYLIAGFPGAVVATIAIFLPSFFFVAALNPLIPRLRSSKWASAFLDAVNVSAVALMIIVTLNLAQTTLINSQGSPFNIFGLDWLAVFITASAAVMLFRYRLNAAWLVVGGAFIGWIGWTIFPYKI
ncbi:MAG: chromate transporter [Symploca sp. SIO2G7]|nr:chromate transporter [Symploca sp. SIO2G7]